MPYRIELTRRAERDLADVPRSEQKKIGRKIEALAEEPRPRGCRKLEGADELYRIRAGDYRVIYTVEDDVLTVLVVKIGNRRDVYR